MILMFMEKRTFRDKILSCTEGFECSVLLNNFNIVLYQYALVVLFHSILGNFLDLVFLFPIGTRLIMVRWLLILGASVKGMIVLIHIVMHEVTGHECMHFVLPDEVGL
jgi:hypothetical protein